MRKETDGMEKPTIEEMTAALERYFAKTGFPNDESFVLNEMSDSDIRKEYQNLFKAEPAD